MATKYNRQQLLFLWVAGGHTEASFTDDVYKFLTAAQGGPPDEPPAPAPKPVAIKAQPVSRPAPAPRPPAPSRAPAPTPAPKPVAIGVQRPSSHPSGEGGLGPVTVREPAQPQPAPQPTFTPIDVVEHGPDAGADVIATTAVATTEYGRNINTVLRVGYQLNAPELALLAMLCLGFGENSWRTYTCNTRGYCGVFQLSRTFQAEHDYTDVEYWARYAYLKGFYGYGGIIPIARAHPNYSPGRITNMCQGAYANLDTGAQYYDGQLPQARAALKAYGPDAKRGIKYRPGSIPGLPYSNSTTGQNLLQQIKAINWAGNIENTFKYMRGGADKAASMAKAFSADLHKIKYVKPAKG